MRTPILFFIFLTLCQNQYAQTQTVQVYPLTRHTDLDRIRREVRATPTDDAHLDERLNALKLWVRLLSFAGADLNPLRAHFTQNILGKAPAEMAGKTTELAAAIDYEFAQLEKIGTDFAENPNQYLMDLKRDKKEDTGEVRAWPTLRGDEGQTGFTTQPGPMQGKLKWKFPAGHAWYATPAFADGKVFIGSPGVSYEAYCLDAKSGEYVWKTHQKENQNQYRTPRAVSPTLVVGDQVIVRELGSGGNLRAAKHFVYVDKNTGKETGEVFAGHVDYRVGYAPFDGDAEHLVYPNSVQEIGAGQNLGNVNVVSFDSLLCVGTRDGAKKWAHYLGEFYSEPLLAGNRVYAGNFAGRLTCLETATGKVFWEVETGGAINVKATIAEGLVVVSNQAGEVLAFESASGKMKWKTRFPVEQRAFQQFSRAVVQENSVYIGSADKNLYSLDLKTGKEKWRLELENWIRSAPIFVEGTLVAATCGGTVIGINNKNNKPEIAWQTEVSTHGIYADLRQYQGEVYAASSDFYLNKIDPKNGNVRWKTSIFESIPDPRHGRILADLVGGGPDYQAGTTIADGVAYFGSPRFVYAVDVESGKELWKFETRGQICGAPAVDGGRVFFGQQGGTDQFYCVDAKTGKLLWKQKLGWVWASPNVKEGKVYLASVAGVFSCLDQKTGKILWQYESHQGAYPAPAFKDNLVYFGAWNGNYYAFDKDSGRLLWQHDIDGHPDSGAACVMDGFFYAQGYASKDFAALDAHTGKEIWQVPLGNEWCNASPTTDGKRVLFSTYLPWLHQAPFPSHTFCHDGKTGKLLYKLPFAGGLTGAVICNGLVFTASTTDSYFRAWDVATGRIRWQYRMGGRAEETCTSIYGNKAFVLGTDGFLYAFE